jgi:PilZ domain
VTIEEVLQALKEQESVTALARVKKLAIRRSARHPVDMVVRIERHNGTVAEGICTDANERGFGVRTDIAVRVGEIVQLTIGQSNDAQTFSARVIWKQDERVGFYCMELSE